MKVIIKSFRGIFGNRYYYIDTLQNCNTVYIGDDKFFVGDYLTIDQISEILFEYTIINTKLRYV